MFPLSGTAAIITVAFLNQRKKQNSLSILQRLERQRCLTEKECYFDVGVMLWSSRGRVLLDKGIVTWALDNRLNNTSVPTTNFSRRSNIFEKRFSDEKTDLISTTQSINHLVPVLASLWKTASSFFRQLFSETLQRKRTHLRRLHFSYYFSVCLILSTSSIWRKHRCSASSPENSWILTKKPHRYRIRIPQQSSPSNPKSNSRRQNSNRERKA